LNDSYFGIDHHYENKTIVINTNGKEFNLLATSLIPNNHFNGDSQCLPLYRYDKSGNRTENITDWGLEQFRAHYGWPTPSPSEREGVRLSIFHYTYAVLHNPAYRKK
jgi:predicted helicase